MLLLDPRFELVPRLRVPAQHSNTGPSSGFRLLYLPVSFFYQEGAVALVLALDGATGQQMNLTPADSFRLRMPGSLNRVRKREMAAPRE